MIVEFVFIARVSQFPQDVLERVKDNTPAIYSQVTWHFINEKEIVNLLWRHFSQTKFCLTIFSVCAVVVRYFRPNVLS